jgi:hypothetical protein
MYGISYLFMYVLSYISNYTRYVVCTVYIALITAFQLDVM